LLVTEIKVNVKGSGAWQSGNREYLEVPPENEKGVLKRETRVYRKSAGDGSRFQIPVSQGL
jgi:hypothetical protein